jgi:hypothetical protein
MTMGEDSADDLKANYLKALKKYFQTDIIRNLNKCYRYFQVNILFNDSCCFSDPRPPH